MIDLLFQHLLSTTLLAALVWLLCNRLRPAPALASLAWSLVLLRALLPAIPLVVEVHPLAAGGAGITAAWNRFFEEPVAGSEAAAEAPPHLTATILLGVWILGAAAFAARDLSRTFTLFRWLRSARPARSELRAAVDAWAGRMGVRPPSVRLLEGLSTPLLVGLVRPRLIWPAAKDVGALDESLIVHELAHLRRRDAWITLLESIACWVWWWNPVVHVARSQADRFKELACDAWVSRLCPRRRRRYAESLLALAGKAPIPAPRSARAPVCDTCANASSSSTGSPVRAAGGSVPAWPVSSSPAWWAPPLRPPPQLRRSPRSRIEHSSSSSASRATSN
jgi:beta-lactamase regulating signal transducer with metallopeptidase domain